MLNLLLLTWQTTSIKAVNIFLLSSVCVDYFCGKCSVLCLHYLVLHDVTLPGHTVSISMERNISTHLKYKLDNIIHMFNPFFCEVNIDTKEAKSSWTCSSTTHETVAPTLCSQHREQASWALMTKQVAQVVARLQEQEWVDSTWIEVITFRKTYFNSNQNNVIQSATDVYDCKTSLTSKNDQTPFKNNILQLYMTSQNRIK